MITIKLTVNKQEIEVSPVDGIVSYTFVSNGSPDIIIHSLEGEAETVISELQVEEGGTRTPFEKTYANLISGYITDFSISNPNGKKYIGQYSDNDATPSTDPNKYIWRVSQGEQGVSVSSTSTSFYLSTSKTSLEGGSWIEERPTWEDGKYIWTKIKNNYSDGTTYESEPVNLTGATGRAVEDISIEYYLSTSRDVREGGSWGPEPYPWEKEKYMWTRSKIVWSNPTDTTYTTPIVDSSWEAVNEIEIGGRNYFKKSDFENPTLSGVKQYGYGDEDYINGFKVTGGNNGRIGYVQFDNVIPENGTYTFSFKMKGTQSLIGNSVKVNICGVVSEQMHSSTDNNYSHFSFTAKVDDWSKENNWVRIEYLNWQYYRFDDIKLEKGNRATDWTPAPEDVEQELANHQNQLDKTIDTDQLNTVVADINADKLSVESYEEFLSSYEGSLKEVNRSIEDVAADIGKALSKTNIIETTLGEGAQDWLFTNTKIRMSDEGITLGDASSGTYLQISSERISFFAGATDEVAYVSGGMLYINKAIFVKSIQVAEYLISKELDGHLTYRFVGMV